MAHMSHASHDLTAERFRLCMTLQGSELTRVNAEFLSFLLYSTIVHLFSVFKSFSAAAWRKGTQLNADT
jgi:hypothetical protein